MRAILAALGAGAVAAATVAAIVSFGERLPDGPQPLAWDREACAECRMHVGDPRFAVQLQVTDGRVLAFDDPGCWFLYEARERPQIHALYFHDVREERWLTREQVRFVPMDGTPMGSGLGATGTNEPGLMTLEQARGSVTAVPPAGHGP